MWVVPNTVAFQHYNRLALKRSADSIDVELDGFRKQIDILSSEIDQVTSQIQQRVDYHATCDA